MENLERLGSSVAQVELLVASLKRENRDLAGRLAQAALERRQAVEAAAAEVARLQGALEQALQAPSADPELAQRLEEAQRLRLEEKTRLEGLLRQLEAQALGSHEQEQLPVGTPDAFREALADRDQARAAFRIAQERVQAAEGQLLQVQAQLEQAQDAEGVAVQQAEAVRQRLHDRERRITVLESDILGLDRHLSEARQVAAAQPSEDDARAQQERLNQLEQAAARLDAEKADLRRQRREMAAYAKERQALKRRVEELLNTLETVRLG